MDSEEEIHDDGGALDTGPRNPEGAHKRNLVRIIEFLVTSCPLQQNHLRLKEYIQCLFNKKKHEHSSSCCRPLDSRCALGLVCFRLFFMHGAEL